VEQATVKGRSVLGGISHELKDMVSENLGYFTRVETLGMSQRSFSLAVSTQDRQEAYDMGKKAAELIKLGKTNVMVNINRRPGSNYVYEFSTVPLSKVVNMGERLLSNEFLKNSNKYFEWLSPLINYDNTLENLNFHALKKISFS
jgi:6-phosphofructokinase 1